MPYAAATFAAKCQCPFKMEFMLTSAFLQLTLSVLKWNSLYCVKLHSQSVSLLSLT